MEGQEGKAPLINPEHSIGQKISEARDAIRDSFIYDRPGMIARSGALMTSFVLTGDVWKGLLTYGTARIAGALSARGMQRIKESRDEAPQK
jgi:hypothetical protein